MKILSPSYLCQLNIIIGKMDNPINALGERWTHKDQKATKMGPQRWTKKDEEGPKRADFGT